MSRVSLVIALSISALNVSCAAFVDTQTVEYAIADKVLAARLAQIHLNDGTSTSSSFTTPPSVKVVITSALAMTGKAEFAIPIQIPVGLGGSATSTSSSSVTASFESKDLAKLPSKVSELQKMRTAIRDKKIRYYTGGGALGLLGKKTKGTYKIWNAKTKKWEDPTPDSFKALMKPAFRKSK